MTGEMVEAWLKDQYEASHLKKLSVWLCVCVCVCVCGLYCFSKFWDTICKKWEKVHDS